jgi:hypothetical protein
VSRYPQAALIIAHAGIADLAALTAAMAGRKGVFFDTSTWSAIDLFDLYRRVPPEQVVYASDYPYGQQPASLFIALRTASRAGYDEADLRNLLGGNASRLADGDELPEPTRPKGDATFELPMQLARIHQYLSMALPMLWLRQPDTFGVLGLVINACAERDGHLEAVTRIDELVRAASDLWTGLPGVEDERERFVLSRLTFRLLHMADVEALTAGSA